uniref:Uncharacterized protein n=1 Tax=Onchocerca volvulus TaxID=6282 RepID=A0A8R1TSH8_ONCVO
MEKEKKRNPGKQTGKLAHHPNFIKILPTKAWPSNDTLRIPDSTFRLFSHLEPKHGRSNGFVGDINGGFSGGVADGFVGNVAGNFTGVA